MANYKVAGNTVVRIDASAGGTLNNITQYVREIEGVGKEVQALDNTHFDDTAERVLGGLEMSTEWVMRGDFDDAATTGPDAIFSTAVGTLLTFEFNPAGTVAGRRKITTEVQVLSYKVAAEVKSLVGYEVRLKQDGTFVYGTN